MSSFRVLSRNIFSNWVAYAIQMVVTFFLTPFVLRELGDARYGVWAIVISITGYYGLLDLGLRAGMTQYITRYFSQGDFDRMNKSASSGFLLHACCAIAVLLVTVATTFAFSLFFSLSIELKNEATWCVLILGCSTAIQLLLFPFSVALTAKQRFDVVTTIGLLCRLFTAAATVGCLRAGYGLVGVCVAGAAGNIINYSIRWTVARRILPELRISWRLANWSSARECMGFGFWSALLAVSHLVINLSDAMVIGIFMPVSAIAFFALANNLIRYFAGAFVPVSQVFFPAATDLDARDDVAGLQKLYQTGSRLLALIAASAALIMCFWVSDFYTLWIGEKYAVTDNYHSVPLLFQILLVGAFFTAAQGIGSKILLGRRRMRGLTWLIAIEGSMNLVISIALIRPYGLLGVAIGTAVPAVICRGLVHPVMVCSDLKLGIKDYTSQILLPTCAVASLLVPALGLLHRCTAHASWIDLLLEGGCAAGLALVAISVAGLNSSDRHQYLYPTIKRVASFRVFFTKAKN